MKGFKMVDERQEKQWEVEIEREYRGHSIKWRIIVDDLSIVASHIDGTIGLFGEVSTTKPQAQTQRPTATQEQGSFKSTYARLSLNTKNMMWKSLMVLRQKYQQNFIALKI